MRKCNVEGCGREYIARGFCIFHYRRFMKGQSLTSGGRAYPRSAIIWAGMAKIPLGENAKDGYAIVDVEFAWLDKYKWFCNKGYAVRNSEYVRGQKRHTIRMHRDIMKTPEGMETDHINGDKLDNRILNLRICTKAENQWNRKKQRGSSKYKGVSWETKAGKWRAQLQFEGKMRFLGNYKSEEEAHNAYKNAAKELFGEYARFD